MSEKKTAVELVREYFELIGYCFLNNITDDDIERVMLSEAAKTKGWGEIRDKENFLREMMEQKISRTNKQ